MSSHKEAQGIFIGLLSYLEVHSHAVNTTLNSGPSTT